MIRLRRNTLQNLLLVAVTAALFFMFMRVTGPLGEDYRYQRQYVDRFDGDAEANSMNFRFMREPVISNCEEAFQSCVNHYRFHDNARMANNICFFANLIPEWSTDLISSFMLVLMIGCMARIGWGAINPVSWGTALCLAFLFPYWKYPMTGIDFLINYLWATAMLLAAYVVVTGRWRISGRWFAPAALLCFFAGTMHEGLAVAVEAGILCFLIQQRGSVKRRQWFLFAFLCLGTALIVFTPSLLSRVAIAAADTREYTPQLYLVNNPLPILFTAFFLFLILITRTRSVLGRFVIDTLPLWCMIVVSLVLATWTRAELRSMFLADIAAAIICVKALCEVVENHFCKTTFYAWGWVCTLSVCGWLGMLSTWRQYIDPFKNKLIELARVSTDRLIYCDVPDSRHFPAISFGIVGNIGNEFAIDEMLMTGSINGMDEKNPYLVLPERFRDIPFNQLPAVPGNARLRGSLPFFYSQDGKPDLSKRVVIEYGTPYSDPEAVPFSHSPFHQAYKALRSAISGLPQGLAEARCISFPVSAEMKRKGICRDDTAYFIYFYDIPPEKISCRIKAIDIL